MKEVFVKAKSLSEYHEVSNYGRVRSIDRVVGNWCGSQLKRGKLLSLKIMKNDYIRVGIRQGGKFKSQYVHRLVAEAFIPNPDNKPCVDHIDGNKRNNHVENLRWVTHKENIENPITKAMRKKTRATKKPSEKLLLINLDRNRKYKGRKWQTEK